MDTLTRILRKTTPSAQGCLEWSGYRDKDGYGQTKNERNVTERTHRISLRASGTPVGKGDIVLHECDNPPCCNPDHLSVGNHKGNYDDMVGKGRRILSYGERNGSAKLTRDQAEFIRARYSDRQTPLRHVAQDFGVSESTIRRVITGKNWK